MKPFDLEKALAGAKVVTRDGQEVTQLTRFDVYSNYPLTGIINKQREAFKLNGQHKHHEESNWDLFMAEEKRYIWVNIYYQESGSLFALSYQSESEAIKNATNSANYIKTIEITNEPAREKYCCIATISNINHNTKSYKISFESKDDLHNFCINGGHITSTSIEK